MHIEVRQHDWMGTRSKNITFIVTEECQLRCRYCYLVHKNNKHVLKFETAKKAVDYILENRDLFGEEAAVIDFIGGEPLLEIKLIDRICDYFKQKAFMLDHPWFDMYRLTITSNGLLYSDPEVQQFIKKNREHLDLTITIDGTKRKHDLQRVFPDGSGSYDKVAAQIPLYLSQFPSAGTKVTIGHKDLPYIHESIIHLWNLGIKNINANVVFEDVWEDGDEQIYEQQLMSLADDIISNEYYKEHRCSLFNRDIGHPVKDDGNWCGSGKMLCVDTEGRFYPCMRFTAFSLADKEARSVGSVETGINTNLLRPFLSLRLSAQSSIDCMACDIGSGCAWCQAANYDYADTPTIYQRAVFICKFHHARVIANKYFWAQLDKIKKSEKQDRVNAGK